MTPLPPQRDPLSPEYLQNRVQFIDMNRPVELTVAVIAVYVNWTVFLIMAGNRDFLSEYGQSYTN